jgi:hypothetical protein
MIHYIYKITNEKSGYVYIGKHSTKDLEDGYFGSGAHLKLAIEEWGIENFKMDIVCFCSSQNELKLMESFIIKSNAISGNKIYNLSGARVSTGKQWTDDHREEHSATMKAYWNNPEWVSKRSTGWIKPNSKSRRQPKKSKEAIEEERIAKIRNTLTQKSFNERLQLISSLNYPDVKDHYRIFEGLGFSKMLSRDVTKRHDFMTSAGYTLSARVWHYSNTDPTE